MLPNKQIDVALVKEFYSNVYDPKDRSSTTCIVRGRIIQFDTETLKEFLGTPITIVEGEQLTTYAHYLHSHPNYEAIAAKLCTPGGRFQLNIEEAPWKILGRTSPP